jgi:hypothetical protein
MKTWATGWADHPVGCMEITELSGRAIPSAGRPVHELAQERSKSAGGRFESRLKETLGGND